MAGQISFSSPNAIAQEMKQYQGNFYSNAVSSHISEINTALNPQFPIQRYDYAYSKQNDFGGVVPTVPYRQPQTPKNVAFQLPRHEFNIQFSQYNYQLFQSMIEQQQFATSMQSGSKIDPKNLKKETDLKVFNYVIEQLAMQVVTRNESLLYNLITNPDQYTPTNTKTITKTVPSWVQDDGSLLMADIAEGVTYLNKMQGNRLKKVSTNESPQIVDGTDLIIVIPQKVYNAFIGIYQKAFSGFNTSYGYDGNGNVGGAYRGLIAGLFANAIGVYGCKVIIAETYFNDSIMNELDTASANFKNFWDQENSIYMFTTSTDILNPASIIKPTYQASTLFSTMFLDTQYLKTSGIYDFVAPQQYAFYKINLTLS